MRPVGKSRLPIPSGMMRTVTNARGRPRKNSLADMAAPPPALWRPQRSLAVECPKTTWDLDDTGIVTERRWMAEGRLEDFVLYHQAIPDEKASHIVKADCCDGEVHVHRYNADGEELRRQVLMPISVRDDLTPGLALARGVVLDHAVENKGAWERG